MKLHSVTNTCFGEIASELDRYDREMLGWEFVDFIPNSCAPGNGNLIMSRKLNIDDPADKALIMKMRAGK